MDLRYLTNETLLKDIDRHVREEREKLTVILHHHLKEVERRRLFSVVKSESTYEFATKHCGYSEDQANRRVAAMRLLKDLPQVEEMVHEIAGHSKRPVGPNMTARKIVLPNETNEKLEKLKRLHAHEKFTIAELIDYLCELSLQELTRAPARPKADSKAEIRRRVFGSYYTEGDGWCLYVRESASSLPDLQSAGSDRKARAGKDGSLHQRALTNFRASAVSERNSS